MADPVRIRPGTGGALPAPLLFKVVPALLTQMEGVMPIPPAMVVEEPCASSRCKVA